MLTENEIIRFIEEDSSSSVKQFARTGQRYYEGDHDILNYKLYYYDADGNLVEDKNRSNIKIPHPFFTELVDQAAQYMLSGKDGFVRSDFPELQTQLDDYFNENENFRGELYDLITGSMSKGWEYMYAYKNAEGKTAFQTADSIGVVEVRAQDTDDRCEYVIYWYIDRIEKGTKKIKRIQVHDSQQTYFYVQEDDGKLLLDEAEPINPRPHVLYTKDGDNATYYDGFGFIPFFRLDNNKKRFSDLKHVKPLIDDYDLMACGLSNNIQDASEYLVVVKGFQGSGMEELIQNIKTKKHIGVDGDDGGDVEFKTVDIPAAARQTKLELDEKNIYRFGMGFNSAQLGDGNVTNVVIKSRYALLDLKCNKVEIHLRQFMRKILKVVLQEINEAEGTDYQQKDVYFCFEREVMTNASDNAQIELVDAQKQGQLLNNLMIVQAMLDSETLLQAVCDILELDYEDVKEKLAAADSVQNAQKALNTAFSATGGEIDTEGENNEQTAT